MDPIIDQIVQVLGAVVASAVIALAVQLLRKMGIALDAERQAQLEYTAKQAVLRVEEQAAAYAKERIRKMNPEDKFRQAVTEVVQKIPRVSQQEAEDIVQAVLPQLGLGAAAGAVKLGEALRTK